LDPHFFWYLTRAAGIVTFALLTFSTALGISISARLGHGLLEKPWVYELHKFAALLALGFLSIHIVVLLPDPWTSFHLIDLFVPGSAAYRPIATAVGVLAMYGALVGTFSFYIKKWIGYRAWRWLHYTTFGTFMLALLHGTLAGTDSSQAWVELMYASAGLLVLSLSLYRFMPEPRPRSARPQLRRLFPDPALAQQSVSPPGTNEPRHPALSA
jgi:sulfoxide reductase heme-binding subunit YedZ